MAEQFFQVTKEEYAELLAIRKDKILRKAQEDAKKIDEQLAKLIDKPKEVVSESLGTDGLPDEANWKEIVAFVLKRFGPELTTGDIITYTRQLPLPEEKKLSAHKSISSVLSINTKGDDAIYKSIERGKKRYYSLIKHKTG